MLRALRWWWQRERAGDESFGVLTDNATSYEALEGPQGGAIIGSNEANRVADCLGATSTADAVHIVLGVHGKVEVDDV